VAAVRRRGAAVVRPAQRLDAQAEVGLGRRAARARGAQDVALAEQRRQLARQRAESQPRPLEHHVRQARVHGEGGHAAAVRGDPAVARA